MTLTKQEQEAIEAEASNKGRCPDFDEDCKCVKNHLKCFMGFPELTPELGVAKGYCPFIHPEN